jgi:glutamate dehydrogenase
MTSRTMTSGVVNHATHAVLADTAADSASAVRDALRQRPDLAPLLERYFLHAAVEDLPDDAEAVLAIVEGHLRLGRFRSAETPKIRVFNPQLVQDSWSAESTVINVVNDDMPFLVDSITNALAAEGVVVQRVLHPILEVRRSSDGELLEVVGNSTKMVGRRRPSDVLHESWMHLLIDRITDAERAERIESSLLETLRDVRTVVADSEDLSATATELAEQLRRNPPPRAPGEIIETADLLEWLTQGTFVFLGAHPAITGMEPSESSDSTGLGLWRDGPRLREFTTGIPPVTASDSALLVTTRASKSSPLAKNLPPFYVGVRLFNDDGDCIGEQRFLGVHTARGLNAEISHIPVLRRLLDDVLLAVGATIDSYNGQRAVELLTSYPRPELFSASADFVVDLVRGVLQSISQRQLRIFLQPDRFRRYISALVFLPRDRYTTRVRLAIQETLLQQLHGTAIRYTARVGDSALAVVNFVVTTNPDDRFELDVAGLTGAVRRTIRTWEDELAAAFFGSEEVLDTAGERSRYGQAFDESYKEHYSPATAVRDLQVLDALATPADLGVTMAESRPDQSGNSRLKVYVSGQRIVLSRALPLLQSLGATVIDENPFDVTRSDGTPSHIYDFGLEFPPTYLQDGGDPGKLQSRFTDAFLAGWTGAAEIDGFNELVLAAGLNWQQVTVFRAYARYLRQIGTPYTQGYLESVVVGQPSLTAQLAELFAIRFDPGAFDNMTDRDAAERDVVERLTQALDDVSNLDADRILRTFLTLILATQRCNAYRQEDRGADSFWSFKLNPRMIPRMPKPVPLHEIFVYAPAVEGVHLRFGDIARGGLRWSERPEDFRTEILGLVKAQEVKNAVIVPVGAKGGFLVKQPPVPTGRAGEDRDAVLAEGMRCYRMFIQGLLDLTDNRVSGKVVGPPDVVRHDGDDSYLVVAPDKGTATFSDLANEVAIASHFWLGDAFASGGSAGYDHKAMGITARGAWESVKQHFREMGRDCQAEDFTVIGIGDMSGDVFGNAMVLSQHIHLVAAFDHRHVFIDPAPDATTSFAERQRLRQLPRSSWADYDASRISTGGGVWPRSDKSVSVSPEMRSVLGLAEDVSRLTPTDLIRAILQAPVDLLFNGGVGTYVKSSEETHQQVGDKSNDAVRVDGADLRAKVVAEGGNLGFTQLGRIEYARVGGRINTDAIDNSAGVDTSDHEVNIKIALEPLQRRGALPGSRRAELLAHMTTDIATLVLADNTAQNALLSSSRAHAASMLPVHARLIDYLVTQGGLDRKLESLPDSAAVGARRAAGAGLTSPELAVLVAYVKSGLAREMLDTELPDLEPYRAKLPGYFPPQLVEQFPDQIDEHPLRRHIVTTRTVNEVVNGGGITYAFRLFEEMAAGPDDAIRAFTVTTEVFALPALWGAIASASTPGAVTAQNELVLESRRLLDRAARWFLVSRPQPLDVAAEIDRYRPVVTRLSALMPRFLRGAEHGSVRSAVEALRDRGAPARLANRSGYLLYTFSLLDITDIATESGRDPLEVAQLYFAMSEHIGLDAILTSVTALDRGDRWHALARQAVRDNLYASTRAIVADVLTTTDASQDADSKIAQWEQENRSRLERARVTLGQIVAAGAADLAALSVAAREIGSMAR